MLNSFQHLLSMIFIRYCRNRFFGRCLQNDVMFFQLHSAENPLSWISFTKTSRSFHYVSTHFCFCNFETTFTSFTSATSRKTIHRIVFLGRVQIRSFQGLINEKIPKKDTSLPLSMTIPFLSF